MRTLRIIPFGNVPEDVLNAISEELRASLNIMTEISEPRGLPKEFYNSLRHQYNAEKILDFLSQKFSGKILAVSSEDLYAEGLNFVFGQAELPGRVCIVSIHRLDPKFYREPENKSLLIERAVKEAKHEVCHALFGLTHCENKNCVMSFSNTIFEVDRKSKDLCNKCKVKILKSRL